MKRSAVLDEVDHTLEQVAPNKAHRIDAYRESIAQEAKDKSDAKDHALHLLIPKPACLAVDAITPAVIKEIVADLENSARSTFSKQLTTYKGQVVFTTNKNITEYNFTFILHNKGNVFGPNNYWWRSAVEWSEKTSTAIIAADAAGTMNVEEYRVYDDYIRAIFNVIEHAWRTEHPEMPISVPKFTSTDTHIVIKFQ